MATNRPTLSLKRVVDVAVALGLAVAAAPLMLVMILLVKLTSAGPVIYSQARVGRDRRLFTIYKVRTMHHDCERLSGPRWSTDNDPRVTAVGRFLRQTHLDELPQLWNIVRGDMSLVGPRPERPEFVRQLEKALPRYAERLAVTPGVTGLAQVNLPPDSDHESVRRKLVLDLAYVEGQGAWLDFRILACTGLFVGGVPFAASVRLFGLGPWTDDGAAGLDRIHGRDARDVGAGIESGRGPAEAGPAPGGAASALGFGLFLVVNALLFIRPAEFHPALLGLPVYEVCIVTCLAVSYPAVAARVSPRALEARPVDACAAGMLAAIVGSHLANGEPGLAVDHGVEFLKLLLYYFLLVGLVDTPARLERFLGALGAFAAVITALAVLHYHDLVEVPAIRFLQTGLDDSGSLDRMVVRLGSTGLFQDPNDMSLMLVMALVVCLYQVVERRRWYWVGPLVLFGHALTLTHSRGGFLGLLAALSVLLCARFGRKAAPLGLLVLPAVLMAFGGRQTSLSLGEGTGQTRVQLWLEGMVLFVRHPLFGIGSERYAEYAGHVAHNSFIHCYTELGLFGGTLFLGAFYLAVGSLVRLGGRALPPVAPALGRQRPYVLAVVVGYATGLMSLSNPYTIPTYTVLGLASVYVALAEREYGVPVMRLEGRLVGRLALVSMAFVVAAQVGVRILARVSG